MTAHSCMAAPMGSRTQRSLSRREAGWASLSGARTGTLRLCSGRAALLPAGRPALLFGDAALLIGDVALLIADEALLFAGAAVAARAAHEPEGQDGEGGESAAPGDALGAKGKVWFDHAGICGKRKE